MKKLFILSIFFLALSAVNFGQQSSMVLSFTAINDTNWIQTDSIRIVNCNRDCDTVLFWSDTVLVIDLPVGISQMKGERGNMTLNCFPNPVTDRATLDLNLDTPGKYVLQISDYSGKRVLAFNKFLLEGRHTFTFIPGISPLYFITVSHKGGCASAKLLCSGSHGNRKCILRYNGSAPGKVTSKTGIITGEFEFLTGDELLIIGYSDTLESGMRDIPDGNTDYIIQFAFDIPCPGMPTVIYEGMVYHTVQVFSQCWLKENLNVGTMISGGTDMTDNGILEKYCYFNDTNRCNQYGGLYQWDEMMAYATQPGSTGICPPGWHIPSDEEWKILEGSVDSQHGIGDQIWDLYGLRGFDAGTHLKSASGWVGYGNGSDLYGFSGLPGGYRYSDGNFYYKGMHALWWSSTDGNATSAWNRYLSYNNPIVDRDYGNNKKFAFNVRCIRDQE